MDIKVLIRYVLVALLLVLLQTKVLNSLVVFNVAVPVVAVFFILKLPYKISNVWLLTIGFLYGMLLDFFDGTFGYYTIASTVMAFIRPYLIALIISKEKREVGAPSFKTLKFTAMMLYVGVGLLVNNTMLFFIENFGFDNSLHILLKVLASTVLSFVLFIIYELLQEQRS